MSELDANTFGHTPAAEILVSLLNDSPDYKMVRWVGRHFSQYSTGMHEIHEGIVDNRTRTKLLTMWFQHAKKQIEEMDIPADVKSYLSNIERTLYRRINKGDFDNRIWWDDE